MSKSPNSRPMKTFILPTFGVLGFVIGSGYALAKTNYGDRKIGFLEEQVAKVGTEVQQAKLLLPAEAEKRATAAKFAEAESARAVDLETQVAQIQERARAVTGRQKKVASAPTPGKKLGLGRTALTEEIAAWDVDVVPGGRGLPDGSGDVATGEEVFADKCASCHGDFAEGADNWPVLAGGFDTLGDADPVKTVGSYWPHLSTAWDYINRSMPFGEAGTLTANETYAIVAYILYSNDLVEDDFELNRDNFADFEMHNKDGFIFDDRPAIEYTRWRTEPCMKNCKAEVKVTMRSVFLVETPADGGTESVMNPASIDDLPTFSADGPSFVPVSAQDMDRQNNAAGATQAIEETDPDAQLIAAGKKIFRKCKSCHAVGEGAKNKAGPHLNNLIGRRMGSIEGFKYSSAFKLAAKEERIWSEATLDEFLTEPKVYAKGTKMSFRGLKKEKDRIAIYEYLRQFE